jgi:predicted MFS family arabinose efflux permease
VLVRYLDFCIEIFFLFLIIFKGYYFEKRRSLAMGIAVCGSGIGTFLFAPINRFLLSKYDWEGAFLIKAAIILNICICGMVMVPIYIYIINKIKMFKIFNL